MCRAQSPSVSIVADSAEATGLKWATPASGGMTLISETSASALSSLSFTSLGSYKQLFLIWSGIRHSNNSTGFGIRFNNSSSSVYTGSGFRQRVGTTDIGANQGTTSVMLTVSGADMYAFGSGVDNPSSGTDAQGCLLLDNYTSTTKSKSFEYKYAYYDSGVGYYYANAMGYFNSTSAITSIDIFRVGTGTFTNQDNTTIRLYGIS